jgi:tetratricopeptide (TPR) repeat protein
VALLDVDRLEEVAFVPGDGALGFDLDGALLTFGYQGIYRWPVSIDQASGWRRFGPPEWIHPFSTHDAHGISGNRMVVAVPPSMKQNRTTVWHRDSRFKIPLGPQDDARNCAVSPDGRWVATGSHWQRGAKIWEADSGRHVADLPVGTMCGVEFSPDGKWLLTTGGGPRLWAAGTWQEGPPLQPSIQNPHAAFSASGKLLALGGDAGVVRLVLADSGTEVARLTAPKKSRLAPRCFTAGNAKLIAIGIETGGLYAFDLLALRAQLAELGLDWDDGEPPPARAKATPPSGIDVDSGDFGMSAAASREYWQKQADLHSALHAGDPSDFKALFARANALSRLGNRNQAVDDYLAALPLAPPHHQSLFGGRPAQDLNIWAWQWAKSHDRPADGPKALEAAQKAVAMAPQMWNYRNTLGVVYYRLGDHDKALAHLQQCLHDSRGQLAGFDLFFIAMCHQHLDQPLKAKESYDQAVLWAAGEQPRGLLSATRLQELTAFRTEAEALLLPR